jgi:alpha-L-fucosidase
LLNLKPGIIHNNRLVRGEMTAGDFETPEQKIPATGIPGKDWETCMTLNGTWGYRSYDTNWKSAETLIRNLVDIASKGGNYLLNVGPTREGLIPEPSIERLTAVGAWMKVNGEAIYDTTASPFKRLLWGRCTKKVAAKETTLYLHIFNWPADGKLVVPGLKNAVRSARLLAGGKKLASSVTEDGVVVQVPPTPPDAISSTVVVRIDGAPEVAPSGISQKADGSVRLGAAEADLRGGLQYESGDDRDNIGYWTNPRDTALWSVKVQRPGKFKVSAEIASLGQGSFELIAGEQKVRGVAPNTGDYKRFQKVELDWILDLAQAGNVTFTVKPVAEGWQPLNLRCLNLVPVER